MTPSASLAAFAAAAAVLGAWELLAALERARIVAWLRTTWAPLARAGTQGAEPTAHERRRLAVLASGCLLGAGWLVAGPLLGVAAATAAPGAVLGVLETRRRRYRARAREGAAGAARAIAAGLSAGRSIRAALGDAAADAEGPAAHELRRAGRALALGEPTDRVLEDLRRRAGGGPWNTLAAAMMLQRDAGGDLAGLLRELAGSLEGARRAERDARAATAQSRATAWMVGFMPLLAAGAAELAGPGFLIGLLSHPVSVVLVCASALFQALALVAIRRLSRPADR